LHSHVRCGAFKKTNKELKPLIPILAFILFLVGLLIFFGTIWFGIGFYTPLFTIATLAGFIISFSNREVGWSIIFITSIGWLLRYFEHASYLILYDFLNIGRWVLVMVPILLSLSLFALIFKERQDNVGKPFKVSFIALSVLAMFSVEILSFIWKPHTDEFNCWYYFDKKSNDFKVTFAVTPEKKIEVISNSKELESFIKKYGIRNKFRPGIYCPETKVKIITRFKKVVSVEILGFRNTELNKAFHLDNPVEIDLNVIKGDKKILQPEFNLGD
jgi:hypothetical protein